MHIKGHLYSSAKIQRIKDAGAGDDWRSKQKWLIVLGCSWKFILLSGTQSDSVNDVTNSEDVSWHRINVNVCYSRQQRLAMPSWDICIWDMTTSSWRHSLRHRVNRTLYNERPVERWIEYEASCCREKTTYTQAGTAVKTWNSNYRSYSQIRCKNINYWKYL